MQGELVVIRHGETVSPDTLNGRSDVALARRPKPVGLSISALWVSPAQRARETATGLFPEIEQIVEDRLWEQDFGIWDGRAYSDLPDIGPMEKSDLANLKAEGGESFHDMAARAEPALRDAAALAMQVPAPVVLVAHAGIVRVALAMAMGQAAAALAFQIAYEGATRLRVTENGFAVTSVNEHLS